MVARGFNDENPSDYMAAAVASRILRVARLYRERFRSSLTRPPTPGSFASRFSSREVCLLERRLHCVTIILGCQSNAFGR